MMSFFACVGNIGRISRCGIVLAAAFAGFTASAGEDGEIAQVQTLPRVQSKAAILKDHENDPKRVPDWIAAFMNAKERKAKLELDVIKKTVQAEEAKRLEADRERKRREDDYRRSIGEYVPVKKDDKSASKIKLDFQVPEIDTYRLAADVCMQQRVLATSITDYLSRLDRDGDGKLTEEDYTNAGAVAVATTKILAPLDANGDGNLSEEELEAGRKLPRNAATALRQGTPATEVANFRIRPYDKDGNGELSVDETKAMVMVFVETGLRLEADATFYRQLAENLEKARAVSAARYAELDVSPTQP